MTQSALPAAAVPETLTKFAGRITRDLASCSSGDPKQARAQAGNLLSEIAVLVKEIVAQYKAVNSQNLFQQFVTGMEQSGNRLEMHNRHVSALSVLLLLSLGSGSMDELTDLAFAGMVHDVCLDKIPPIFFDKHLNGDDLTLGASRLFYKDHLSNSYYAHVELAMNQLKASPTPVNPGTLRAVEHHHENYDGSGLLGIQGAKIFKLARILRIADDLICLIFSESQDFTIESAFRLLQEINQYPDRRIYDPDMLELFGKKLFGTK